MEKQALLLVEELSKAGHPCGVISVDFPGALPAPYDSSYLLQRLRGGNTPIFGKLILAFKLFWVLWLNRKKYDVLHAHTFSDIGLLGVFLGNIFGYASTVKMPNVGNFGVLSLKKTLFGFLRILILKTSDSVVALSTESVQELLKVGYPKSKIILTPNGVKIHPRNPFVNPRTTDKKIIKVGFLGRLMPQKNIGLLIRALHRIEKEIGAGLFQLVLAGEGPLKNELIQMASEMDSQNKVSFLGHVEKVENFLCDIDVLVLPSNAEGNSNAVLEAMAFGLPVVATRVGGTETLLGPDNCHVLFEPNDLDGLVTILKRSLEYPDFWRLEGAKNYDRVNKFFNITEVSKFYVQAYSTLVCKKQKREFICHGVFK
ncbi:glycosyltransferase [Alphaproteobacteria bacterium]|nr:glycosyltransferase [Alphaproteobacteria bacterium]